MMKKVLLVIALLGLSISNVFAKQLNNFVVFGDSLSDNGNLYEYFKHQIPPSPPYYKGRFSNGLVWVEQLAKTYYPETWKQHILNYAFGGAGVTILEDEDGNVPEEEVLFSLGREVDSYLLSHQSKADANSLYTVWIGSNNYVASHNNPERTAKAVITGITKSLDLLATRGAKHIMVMNLPDMGNSPAARLIHSEKELSQCSRLHNAALSATIEDLRAKYPDIQWILYDVAKEFDDAFVNPEKYGFTNVTGTCYQTLVTPALDAQFVLRMSKNMQQSSDEHRDNCAGYFFFDSVHPTTYAHKIMAERLKQLFSENDISFGAQD